jgi:hypothetical protein
MWLGGRLPAPVQQNCAIRDRGEWGEGREESQGTEGGEKRMTTFVTLFNPQNNSVRFPLNRRGKSSAPSKGMEPEKILYLPTSEAGAFPEKPGCILLAR